VHPVALGRIGAPHGVRGWVRVQSWTRPPEAILGFGEWLVGEAGDRRPCRVAETAVSGKALVARLEGVDDREGAAALRHAEIAVPRDALPDPEPGEWYWADLEGLAVATVDGVPLGHVDHLLETGANDVLVVRGERERLIPWIMERTIRRVDPEQGRIVVDWDPDF
jgi:16S rRNA processing protein RimM